jgi:AcrR family transcriptional regulator
VAWGDVDVPSGHEVAVDIVSWKARLSECPQSTITGFPSLEHSVRTRTSSSLGRRVRRPDQAQPVARKLSTKDLLINVGEHLFGRFGIDAVSLREIAAAAGQTSSNAVQYHFKDKHGLVLAILNDRLHRHEAQRRERLETLQTAGMYAPHDLLRVLWESIVSIRGPDGQHSFCRFVLQYLLQPQGPDHPTRNLAAYRRSRKVPVEFASLLTLNRLLRECYPDLTTTQFDYRLKAVATMFLAAVVEHDNAQLAMQPGDHAEFDLESIVDLATAALGAPVIKRPAALRQPR